MKDEQVTLPSIIACFGTERKEAWGAYLIEAQLGRGGGPHPVQNTAGEAGAKQLGHHVRDGPEHADLAAGKHAQRDGRV